jgi:hypothetical protein
MDASLQDARSKSARHQDSLHDWIFPERGRYQGRLDEGVDLLEKPTLGRNWRFWSGVHRDHRSGRCVCRETGQGSISVLSGFGRRGWLRDGAGRIPRLSN